MKLIRRKRLKKVLLILLGASLGIFLILYSLNNKLDYFYTASDFKSANFSENRRVKLGGMVLDGSVKRNKDGIIFLSLIIKKRLMYIMLESFLIYLKRVAVLLHLAMLKRIFWLQIKFLQNMMKTICHLN